MRTSLPGRLQRFITAWSGHLERFSPSQPLSAHLIGRGPVNRRRRHLRPLLPRHAPQKSRQANESQQPGACAECY